MACRGRLLLKDDKAIEGRQLGRLSEGGWEAVGQRPRTKCGPPVGAVKWVVSAASALQLASQVMVCAHTVVQWLQVRSERGYSHGGHDHWPLLTQTLASYK